MVIPQWIQDGSDETRRENVARAGQGNECDATGVPHDLLPPIRSDR